MLNSIVAFSDSHGVEIPQKLLNIIKENNYVFFLGDGIQKLGDVLFHKNLYIVNGNCDYPTFKDEEILEIDGLRILLTHGHKYHVKSSLLSLKLHAKELNCDVVFYGHTHFPQIVEDEGITFICPGSTGESYYGDPTYAYCVINNGKIISQIVNI